jgi:hypothetical protein
MEDDVKMKCGLEIHVKLLEKVSSKKNRAFRFAQCPLIGVETWMM